MIEPSRNCHGDERIPAEALPDSHSRSALLEAGLQCFAHRGFDGTSIRDIAAKAMRNSSLISHYFGGKEGLYEEVFRYILQSRKYAFGQEAAARNPAPTNREEAIELLHDLIRAFCAEFISERESSDPKMILGLHLVLNELREPRPRIVALLREHVAPWIRRFEACLRILKPELTEVQCKFLGISVMGEMMAHMMMHGIHLREWGLDEIEGAEAVKLLTEFNLRALGVSVPSSLDDARKNVP